MNKFMVIACLAVIAGNCLADVSLGYRYQVGQGGGYTGGNTGGGAGGSGSFLSAPVAVAPITSSYRPTASGSNYFNQVPAIGQQSIGATHTYQQTSGGGSIVDSGSSNDNIASIALNNLKTGNDINYNDQDAYLSQLVNYQPAQVSKHFYFHTAPEDHDDQQIVRYVNVGRPQKNYRVVFINAPSSSTNKAKIIANVAPVEDKTAIYVLSKKANALDVSAEVVTPAPVNNKPEVFFIKYKTPQEAQHAQQTIQAQYDALGGSSQVSDEGVLPVSSVIGSLQDDSAAGVITDSNGGVNIVGTGGVPSAAGGNSNYDVNSGASNQIVYNGGQVHSGNGGGGNTGSVYLPAALKK